jgi:hypothetical protein
VLGFIVVLSATAWFLVERYIQADRYRPLIRERIATASGMPVELGEIDLTLLPVPSAHVRNVVVGEGMFRLVCDDVVVYPRLESLGRGEIEIGEIALNGLVVTLPSDLREARQRITSFADTVSQNARDSGSRTDSRRFSVGSIYANDARLFFGDTPDHALQADLSVDDVLSETIAIHGEGSVPFLGAEARFEGDVAIARNGDPAMRIGVQGNVSLFDVDSTTFVKTRNIPSGVMDVDAAFERTGPKIYHASLEGRAAPHAIDGIDIDPLAGEFTAQAWWDAGTVTVNDFLWQSDAIALRGDLSVPRDDPVAVHITQLQVSDVGINGILAFRPEWPVRVVAERGATFSGEDVLFGLTENRYIRLVEGGAHFEGISVSARTGERAFQNVGGDVSFHEGVIRVNRIESSGVSLTGDVTPDFATGVTEIELSGHIDLTRERLLSLVNLPRISEATGRVELSQIKATIVPGEGLPADLVVEGSIQDGALGIESEAWSDRLAPLSATFTAEPGRIATTATATSQKLGATTANGEYLLDAREWRGTVHGDLSKMDLPFLKQEAAKDVAPGIVSAYGPSDFAITLAMPSPERARVSVAFDRDGAPELAGAVAWHKVGETWQLGDVQVDATIPGTTLQPMLPDHAAASGDVGIQFDRSVEKAVFDADIDLTSTRLTLGEYLGKASGVDTSLEIHGEASPAIWQAKTIAIQCLGETANGRFEEERFVIDPLDLNVSALAPLLARGGETQGRIQGRIATNPTEVAVTLTDFGASLRPELAIDSVNGSVYVGSEIVRIDNLAVTGANSDCVIVAEKSGERWSGNVTGRRLDINGVDALLQAFRDYRDESEPVSSDDAADGDGQPFNGTFSANLDTLIYRQAHFENASAKIVAENGRLEVNDLRLAREGGSITGTFTITGGKPAGQFSTQMLITNVPAQVIDELAFVESRGLEGTLNGSVALAMPTGEGINPTHGASGNVVFNGVDGSFGKLGIATQILTVLRTIEITQLRMPTLQDEGLTYETCDARISMNNGLMTVEQMAIRTPTYLITAEGNINFPANETELLVHVSFLEGVLSAGGLIPGMRELADQFRKLGGVRILVTGPPDNPSTSYGFGPPIVGGITDEVRSTLKSTSDLVREQIFDRATDALRGILK